MAAVIGLEDDALESVCREASGDDGVCVPANFNSPGQIVISGDVPAVERVMELAKAAGAKRALPLNVSGAFH
jgi:[acyl-carrier-protein] S-malonyltransferase